MRLTKQHSKFIIQSFENMTSTEELLDLLNYSKKLLYGEKSKPLKLSSLYYYANHDKSISRYTRFKIAKKSGGTREIMAPCKGLKVILRCLNLVFSTVYQPNDSSYGFTKKRTIVDNAKLHLKQNYVFNVDLSDFFHSFDLNKVKYQGLLLQPIGMGQDKDKLAVKNKLAYLIACLCTHKIVIDDKEKIVLPQGSPTSPILSNILCEKLDRRLKGLAKRFGATYSRYADDMTFSSPHNIYNEVSAPEKVKNKSHESFLDFRAELVRIVNLEGLSINDKKTRLQSNKYKQEVTGITVNEKPNVNKRYVNQIRMYLYYWEKYSFEKAYELYQKDYKLDKSHIKENTPKLEEYLRGKIEFLKIVKGESDSTYKKIKKRFNKLINKESRLSEIIEVWETEGWLVAKDFFNSLTKDIKKSKSEVSSIRPNKTTRTVTMSIEDFFGNDIEYENGDSMAAEDFFKDL